MRSFTKTGSSIRSLPVQSSTNRETKMRTSGLAESESAGSAERTGRLGAPVCALREETAPVLLLGLGNPLMSDDGAGQEVLARLESGATTWGSRVEFLDGGTQGLALLGRFEGRKAVVFLDAIRLGDKAGAVHVLEGAELLRLGGGRATTAHEGSAPQILAALQLLGEAPRQVTMIGIEPEEIKTGIGVSAAVGAEGGGGARV